MFMTSDSMRIAFTGQIHNLADLLRELGIPEQNADVILMAALGGCLG